MGFASSFCTHMRNRSFQYMVRSTYDLFENTTPSRDSYSYKIPEVQSKRVDKGGKSAGKGKVAEPKDKNGKVVRPDTCVEYNGEKKYVVSVTPKMVYFRDGKRVMASNVVALS